MSLSRLKSTKPTILEFHLDSNTASRIEKCWDSVFFVAFLGSLFSRITFLTEACDTATRVKSLRMKIKF